MQGWGSVLPLRQFQQVLLWGKRFSLHRSQRAVAHDSILERLRGVHRAGTETFQYVGDPPGKDVWEMPRWRRGRLSKKWIRFGDCEDWALWMRDQFLLAGVPRGALRLATCRTDDGTGHVVLTVDFEHAGTCVSDVRFADLFHWEAGVFLSYQWLCRQVAGRRAWERIGVGVGLGELVWGRKKRSAQTRPEAQ